MTSRELALLSGAILGIAVGLIVIGLMLAWGPA